MISNRIESEKRNETRIYVWRQLDLVRAAFHQTYHNDIDTLNKNVHTKIHPITITRVHIKKQHSCTLYRALMDKSSNESQTQYVFSHILPQHTISIHITQSVICIDESCGVPERSSIHIHLRTNHYTG